MTARSCSTCRGALGADAVASRRTGLAYCGRKCAAAPSRIGATTLLGEAALRTADEGVMQQSFADRSEAEIVGAMRELAETIKTRPSFSEVRDAVKTALRSRPMIGGSASAHALALGAFAAAWYSLADAQMRQRGIQIARDLAADQTVIDQFDLDVPIKLMLGVAATDVEGDAALAVTAGIFTIMNNPNTIGRPGFVRAAVQAIAMHNPTPATTALLRWLLIDPARVFGQDVPPSELYGNAPQDTIVLRTGMVAQVREYARQLRFATSAGRTGVLYNIVRLVDIYHTWFTSMHADTVIADAATCVRLLREIAMAYVDPAAAVDDATSSQLSALQTNVTKTANDALQAAFAAVLGAYNGDIEQYLMTDVRLIGSVVEFDDYVELYALIAALRSLIFARAYRAVKLRNFPGAAIVRLCLATDPALLAAPTPVLRKLDYAALLSAEVASADHSCLLAELIAESGSRAVVRDSGVLREGVVAAVVQVVDPTTGSEQAPLRRHISREAELYEAMERDEAERYAKYDLEEREAKRLDLNLAQAQEAVREPSVSWDELVSRAALASATAAAAPPAPMSTSSSSSSKRQFGATETALLPSVATQAPGTTLQARRTAPAPSTPAWAATTTAPVTPSSALGGGASSSLLAIPQPNGACIGVAIDAMTRAKISASIASIKTAVGRVRLARFCAALGPNLPTDRVDWITVADRVSVLDGLARARGLKSVHDATLTAIKHLFVAAAPVSQMLDVSDVGRAIAAYGATWWKAAVLNHALLALGDPATQNAAHVFVAEFFADIIGQGGITGAIQFLFRTVPALAGLVGFSDATAQRLFVHNITVTLNAVFHSIFSPPGPDVDRFKAGVLHAQFSQIVALVPYGLPLTQLSVYLPRGNVATELFNASPQVFALTSGTPLYAAVSAFGVAITTAPINDRAVFAALSALGGLSVAQR